MPVRSIAWLCLVGLGCTSGVMRVDAGPDVLDSGALDAGPCTWAGAPTALSVAQGGRLEVPLVAPAGGSWRLEGASGLRVARATDAGLLVKVGLDGGSVRLVAACPTGVSTTVEVPVTVRRPQWVALSQWAETVAGADGGPRSREYGVTWVVDDVLYLQGGFHYLPRQFTTANDWWAFSFDAGQWREVSSAGPLRGGHRVAPFGDAGAVLAWAGTPDGRMLSTGLTVLSLDGGASPIVAAGDVGSYQPGFFFDARRNRYVSFCGGGTSEVGCSASTLTQGADGGWAWAPLAVTGSGPQSRAGFAFAYDPVTDRAVFFGGTAGMDILADTWALDFSSGGPQWASLADDATLLRRNGGFALDPVNHRLLIYGGTPDGQRVASPVLIAFDLDRGDEGWVVLEPGGTPPEPRASALGEYDPVRRRLVIGLGNDDTSFNDLWAVQF